MRSSLTHCNFYSVPHASIQRRPAKSSIFVEANGEKLGRTWRELESEKLDYLGDRNPTESVARKLLLSTWRSLHPVLPLSMLLLPILYAPKSFIHTDNHSDWLLACMSMYSGA